MPTVSKEEFEKFINEYPNKWGCMDINFCTPSFTIYFDPSLNPESDDPAIDCSIGCVYYLNDDKEEYYID